MVLAFVGGPGYLSNSGKLEGAKVGDQLDVWARRVVKKYYVASGPIPAFYITKILGHNRHTSSTPSGSVTLPTPAKIVTLSDREARLVREARQRREDEAYTVTIRNKAGDERRAVILEVWEDKFRMRSELKIEYVVPFTELDERSANAVRVVGYRLAQRKPGP